MLKYSQKFLHSTCVCRKMERRSDFSSSTLIQLRSCFRFSNRFFVLGAPLFGTSSFGTLSLSLCLIKKKNFQNTIFPSMRGMVVLSMSIYLLQTRFLIYQLNGVNSSMLISNFTFPKTSYIFSFIRFVVRRGV